MPFCLCCDPLDSLAEIFIVVTDRSTRSSSGYFFLGNLDGQLTILASFEVLS
jgi:hypothetical protein